MVIPSEFARVAVIHGKVAAITDPHEIANVLGIERVRFMIRYIFTFLTNFNKIYIKIS